MRPAEAIRQAYEQWDGSGSPRHLHGEEICLPARLVQLAGPVEIFTRRHGLESARRITRRRRGSQFDPMIADVFDTHAEQVLDGLDDAASWEAILALEPRLSRSVAGADLDRVLAAIGDLVDMKTPFLAGHSRGVAQLVAEAARVLGLPTEEVTTLRQAGLLHDLGRLGVSNAIWDKPGPLTDTELERVRMHPYLTERMLAHMPALASCRQIAGRHHERLDGSGYPRGLTGASLSTSDRLLAAADHYHELTEPRPHRPPLTGEAASARLSLEVTSRTTRRCRRQRGPGRGRTPGTDATRLAQRSHPPRGRRAPVAGPRPPHEGHRPAAVRRPQDRLEPHRAHLHQTRSEQPGRRHPVRHTARLRQQLRTRIAHPRRLVWRRR